MVEPQLLDPSSYGHSPLALPIGAVAVASLCVGLWVVAHERARRVSLSLLVTTAMLAMYLGGFAVMVSASRPDVALFWGKAAYLGVPFIVPAIYQFSMDLLGLGRQRRRLIRAAWGVGLLYMVLAVGTDLLVPGVLRMEWGYVTRITAWHLPFIFVSLGVLGLTGRDYARQYRAAAGTQRARIRWFAIPIVIASLAFIDYGASLGLPVAPWGFVFFAVFLASAAAAVARYHLPDLTPAFAADQIVRTMAEPLLVCDAAGVIAFANPAAERLLGWPAGELVGQPLHTLFGLARARALLEGEPRTGLELEIMSRTGELVAVAVSTNWIQATGGRNVGLVVVARDIRERHRSAQALERREQYFRALIEHARDTITILDGEGRITYDSPAARELLGPGAASAVGSSMGDRLHPEDRGGMLEMFEELMERPGGVADAECRVRDSSGGYRVMELRATNLLAHPAVGGVVVNGRDVTEERHLSEQLQHAQRMEAVGRLAGGVAHDFNNILTAIQGNVAILRDELSGRGPCPEELQEIQRGADRAGRLTDQLLAFSRRQVVRPEPLDLNALVADLRSMLERLIGEGIRLETRTAPDLGLVHADRGHLEQVIMNLVVNARDALEGAGRLQISTENASIDEAAARAADFQLLPGEYVLLRVADEGHGMDEATRSRLFEPFFTTKEAGKGTGLGLATVYGSVRQASGHIGVETRPGRGTTFSIYLPRLRGAPAARSASREPAGEAAVGQGEMVLVAEDEAPVRTLIARVLERRGYRVLQAASAEEALELVAGHDGVIDLLVADLVMPGLSGRELADRLRDEYPDLSIILISGYTEDEVVRHGILTGERDFLPKPFTPATLARKVASVLQARPVNARRGSTEPADPRLGSRGARG